jgi:Putative zinc-finger
MNCEDTNDKLRERQAGTLAELPRRQLESHLHTCKDCQAIARSFDALQSLRGHTDIVPPSGLLERVAQQSRQAAPIAEPRSRFWAGVGVGAALAASIMVAVITSGILERQPELPAPPALAEAPQIALGEPRNIDIAIDLPRNLENATITVVLNGGIEIDGYAGLKELSWTTDLQAGVNKLTLPVVALDQSGGQLLVTVGHGNKQRRFTTSLKLPG